MKTLLSFCLVLYSFNSESQELKMTISNKFKVEEYVEAVKCGNSFYNIQMKFRGSMHSLRIQKFDGAMNEIKNSFIENGAIDFGPAESRLVNFNNNVFLIYLGRGVDTNRFYIAKVDTTDLSLAGSQVLFSFPQKKRGLLALDVTIPNMEEIIITESPDGKQLLIAFTTQHFIASCVFDQANLVLRSNVIAQLKSNFRPGGFGIDNDANKYFNFEFTERKNRKMAVYVENKSGEYRILNFEIGQKEYEPKKIFMRPSGKSPKAYVYANYYGDHYMEGIVLATINGSSLSIDGPKLIPYSDDLKEAVYKTSFGYKGKAGISIYNTDYDLIENQNGALAMFGQCIQITTGTFSNGAGSRLEYYGPVIAIFIQENKQYFTIVPTTAPFSISPIPFPQSLISLRPLPFGNKFICLYIDYEKESVAGNPGNSKSKSVIVTATYDESGNLIARKMVGDYGPTEGMSLHNPQKISENRYLFRSHGGHFSGGVFGVSTFHPTLVRWIDVLIE